MDDNIIKSILEIDSELWRNPVRFKAFLMDLAPKDKIIRNIIMVSVDEGIPEELVNKKIITQIETYRMIKRIISSSGCELSYALKVFQFWVDAFGIVGEELTDDIYYYPIDKLNLRWDHIDKLELANINTIRELSVYSREELLSIKGVGNWFLENVINALKEYGLSLRSDDIQSLLYGYPSTVKEYDKETNNSWAHKLFMNAFKYNYEWTKKYKDIVDKTGVQKREYILYQNYEIANEVGYILGNIQKIIDHISNDLEQKFIDAISDAEKSGNPLFLIKYIEDYFVYIKELIDIKRYIRRCSVSERFERAFELLVDVIEDVFDCLDVLYDGIVNALYKISLMEYSSLNDNEDNLSSIKTSFVIDVSVNIKSDKLKQFAKEIDFAYSLPVDKVSNLESETVMNNLMIAFRKDDEVAKSKEKEEFFNSLSNNLLSKTKKVVDSSGIRWFKCKYCNLIGQSQYFDKIGYNYNSNIAICKYCFNYHKDDIDLRRRDDPVQSKIDEKCPQCGAKLRLLHGKYGEFIGCTSFPKCRYSRNIKNDKS